MSSGFLADLSSFSWTLTACEKSQSILPRYFIEVETSEYPAEPILRVLQYRVLDISNLLAKMCCILNVMTRPMSPSNETRAPIEVPKNQLSFSTEGVSSFKNKSAIINPNEKGKISSRAV